MAIRSLRQRVGRRLLATGAEAAFDHQRIRRGVLRDAAASRHDQAIVAELLLPMAVLSRLKVRLGLLLLASPPSGL